MASRPAARVSWVLLLVLAAAVAIGATASILVNPNSSSPASSSSGPTPQLLIPSWVFVAGILAMLGVIVLIWVLLRIDSKGMRGIGNNPFLAVLFAIAVISMAVIAVRVLGIGPLPAANLGGGGTVTVNNSTNTTPSGNFGNLSGAGTFFVVPGIPPWLAFAVLAAVVFIAVAIAIPQTRRYLRERRLEGRGGLSKTPSPPAGVREALARASEQLDLGGDPRLVILALYEEMLRHLRPMVGSLETATPEEIRAVYLERFGVRREAARTLTRLFEEARYSLHPMGSEERDRARDAVRATIDDLDRKNVAS